MQMNKLMCAGAAVLGLYVTISAAAQGDLIATNTREAGASVTPTGLVYK